MTAVCCPECGTPIAAKDEPDPITAASPWAPERCRELTNSNEPPNAAELDVIRPFLSNIATRLTRFDNEITQLKAQLQHLEAERETLAKYHTRHAGIVSALRRVPTEILAEIFDWTLPAIDEVKWDVSDLKQSPWVLTQVSSLWRGIAIAIPSLWAVIGWSDYDACTSPPLAMIQAQVDRARNLRIGFSAYESGNAAAQVEMFEFLSEHSSRWVDLDLQMTAALVPRLAALRGRISSLQRLWLQWDTDQTEAEVHSVNCFQTASSLLDVGFRTESRFIPILFPAHHFTAYRVHVGHGSSTIVSLNWLQTFLKRRLWSSSMMKSHGRIHRTLSRCRIFAASSSIIRGFYHTSAPRPYLKLP
ncbi:hypothetical protein FB45DRAFT_111603 [Roridomyces roridus]|uniref:F-box domain-containing protein n=1 Tax=Roridomyces roridus TaxID=1738132 RepID=A0AAD7BKA9_9AGAR|nr:hypothetical protein FB45DRAFT_111603 [Roridomyces roridus]